jgi:uncharacterized NAD(P)/FAD-binding protein YdhS
MKRRRIAIVGAGFSGAALAANLLKRGRAAPDVVLVERRQRFGPGLAYGGGDAGHLLNVRAGNLGAFADKPDHFARWLGGDPTRFVPRTRFGKYIEHVLSRASSGWFGPKLTRVRDSVVACRCSGDGWVLALESGKSISADAVVLATGNPPPIAPGVFEQNGAPLIDPWDSAALARLPAGDVLLLGAGLTMVDVAVSLAKRRRKGVIYAISRRGLAPRGHLSNPAPATPAALDLPVQLSEALLAFRREQRERVKRGEPWQYSIDRLRARTPELWQRLPLDAQLRFLRHLRVWWDVHRHRAAPEVAARVAELQSAGRLKVLAGEISSVEQEGRVFHLQHRQRGSFSRHKFDVVGVVNCTGAALDPWLSTDPFVRQLLDEGIARAHPNGLGFDVDPDGRVLSAEGATQDNLFALGPVTQGAFWESTAVPEIRVRAAAIAMMLAPEA